MKLSSLGEFGLIERIRKRTPKTSSRTLLGIGDDAAAIKVSSSSLLIATTDMLLEGVHFDLTYTDLYSLGWKSAAVNLSDIAAMGGTPRACLVSIGIPSSFSVEQIEDLYEGLQVQLDRYSVDLVGGDTCKSLMGLMINITILGEVKRETIVSRAGARPGDRIFVTGTLGDSAAGLEILKGRSNVQGFVGSKRIKMHDAPYNTLILRHLCPIPRIEWGRKIALADCASAMIDISDGLSSDLEHICKPSNVGAVIVADKIPLSKSLQRAESILARNSLDYALSGGEDYELLVTVPLPKVKKLRSLKIPLTEIGEISLTKKLLIADTRGKKTSLRPQGYDHFKH